jgi:putative acetyltransferase
MQLPLPSREAWRKRLADPPDGLFSLVACADGEVVGSFALETSPAGWRMRHVGGIGMGRPRRSARKRHRLEADGGRPRPRGQLAEFNPRRASDLCGNAAGIALYKKFGFEVEGTHRRLAFRDGEYVDAYSMARVKG